MKGLFLKDLLLMGKRRNSVLVFVGVMLIMGFTMGGVFLVGYGTMLFGIFAISSLSYDDFDNCMPFLLSLPVTRRQYVMEKYLFAASGVATGWLMSILVSCILCAVKGEPLAIVENASEAVILLPVFLAVISIWIPIEMKFGVEKSRTVIAVIGGAAVVIGFAGSKLFPDSSPEVLQRINTVSPAAVVIIMFVICFAFFAAGFSASCGILNKKEY